MPYPYGRRSFFYVLTEWIAIFISIIKAPFQALEKKFYYRGSKQTVSPVPPRILSNDRKSDNNDSRISINPESVKQGIIIGYFLAILLQSLYVPWKIVKYNDNAVLINFSLGYSFLFSPPMPSIAFIDYGLVIFGMIATTAIAVILYVLKDKLAILINRMI